VTSRVSKIEVDRQRDWKQVNPMAATCKLDFDNSDRYFSTSYTPTAAETAAGYFNAELDEDLGVDRASLGFWFSAVPLLQRSATALAALAAGPYGGSASRPWLGPELAHELRRHPRRHQRPQACSGTATLHRARRHEGPAQPDLERPASKRTSTPGTAIRYLLNICNM
jgi:hypothetical protein